MLEMTRGYRPFRWAVFAVVGFACLQFAPASQAAKTRGLMLGFADQAYVSGSPAMTQNAFDKSSLASADIARVNLSWRSVAQATPTNPRDPADPAYNFSAIDEAVDVAAQHGQLTMITIYSAPDYAEGPDRPASAGTGTWRPQPSAFADFAAAVATRYSGHYGGLPHVIYYQAWNEPNLNGYLSPQWGPGNVSTSPDIYRSMLNAFYDAVKGVDPTNIVVVGGTSPFGDVPGKDRTRPVAFWRDVFCLDATTLQARPCAAQAKFDVFAHHPISTSLGPTMSAFNPDDAPTPDFHKLVDVLRAAEAAGTLATPGVHPAWASEIWWDTNPPDAVEGIPPLTQARFLLKSLYILWKQKASAVINLQVQDQTFNPNEPYWDNSTGVFFVDGTPKPGFTAFHFPFVLDRIAARRFIAWGRAPIGGRLKIQARRHHHWRKVKAFSIHPHQVFKKRINTGRSHRFRARVAGEKSLVWKQR